MEEKNAIYWEKRMLGWFKVRNGEEDVDDDVGNPGELIGRTIMFKKADGHDDMLPPSPWWGMIAEVYWSGGNPLFIVPASTAIFREIYFWRSSPGSLNTVISVFSTMSERTKKMKALELGRLIKGNVLIS